jgi:hypothetical protein
MSKAVRFPRKLEVWVSEAIADGFEALAADQLLSVSDHARQALALYLRQAGILPQQRSAASGRLRWAAAPGAVARLKAPSDSRKAAGEGLAGGL